MNKKLEKKYYTYIPLNNEYEDIDEIDFSIKVGYGLKYKGRVYEIQQTPGAIQIHRGPNGEKVVLDLGWCGYDGGYEINGVYLAVQETYEDSEAREARELAAKQKEKEIKLAEKNAKKDAEQKLIEEARAALEKAGWTVTK